MARERMPSPWKSFVRMRFAAGEADLDGWLALGERLHRESIHARLPYAGDKVRKAYRRVAENPGRYCLLMTGLGRHQDAARVPPLGRGTRRRGALRQRVLGDRDRADGLLPATDRIPVYGRELCRVLLKG